MAKKWQEEEPHRLVAVKEEAKTEIIKEAIDKVLEYEMTFRCLALHLIRKRDPGIDFSGINFLNMKGHNIPDPNDRSSKVPEGEESALGVEEKVEDDEENEVDDSATLEDVGDDLNKSTIDLPSSLLVIDNVPLPSSDDVPYKDENV